VVLGLGPCESVIVLSSNSLKGLQCIPSPYCRNLYIIVIRMMMDFRYVLKLITTPNYVGTLLYIEESTAAEALLTKSDI